MARRRHPHPAGTIAFTPLAGLYLLAAFVHAALATLVLVSGPRKKENWLVVVVLALTGASSLARGLNTAGEGDIAYAAAVIDFEWPLSFFVLALALVYPRNRLMRPWAKAAAGVGGAVALVLWAVVIFAKGTFYVPAEVADRPGFTLSGPWTLVVDDLRYYVTMAAALGLFGAAFARSSPTSSDTSAKWLLLAFSLGPLVGGLGFVVGPFAEFARGDEADRWGRFVGQLLLVVTGDPTRSFWAIPPFSVLLAAIPVFAIAVARRRGHRVGKFLIFAVALTVSSLTLQFTSAWTLFTGFGDLAYVLVRPFLIGYAVLRHQLFDVDVRAKRGVTTTLAVIAAGLVFLPVEETVRNLSGLGEMSAPLGMAAGLAVTLALYSRIQHLAEGASAAIFRNVRDEDTQYLEEKKREVYRAALERALDDRLVVAPAALPDLARMRGRLGLREGEHDALLADVRARLRTDPAPHDGIEPGTVLFGRYRVTRVLGEGATGQTYLGEDTRLGRPVAMKEVVSGDAKTRRNALREARILAGIRHPRVVTLYDAHESGARTFLVMEYVPGGSLADRLRRGPVVPEDARRLLQDVLLGLAAVHAAGLVHRDVKPSNVLLDQHGRAKVADLGVAHTGATITGVGIARAGTPAYMAPEQVLDVAVDARSDIYAAGAVLYEMLAGEPYVRKAQREGVLVEEAVVSRPPPLPLPNTPPWANAFLERALRKDASERFASADEALDALGQG